METVVSRDRPLEKLFERASSEELGLIADLITDRGSGRLALDRNIKTLILKRKDAGTLQSIADVLDEEIRAFGGNSIANLKRGSVGIPYLELLTDVAKKIGAKVTAGMDAYALEQSVIERALAVYGPKASAAQAEPIWTAESKSIALTSIVTELTSTSGAPDIMSKKGAATAATALGAYLVAAVAATPASLAAGNAGVYEAMGPAYRITIPAVIVIAMIRTRQIAEEMNLLREELKACL